VTVNEMWGDSPAAPFSRMRERGPVASAVVAVFWGWQVANRALMGFRARARDRFPSNKVSGKMSGKWVKMLG
jgi:hypothetical protein